MNTIKRISMALTAIVLSASMLSVVGCAEKHTHTPGTPVKENEVAATCTTEGSYDEVVYCTEDNEEISRTKKTVEKIAHTPGEAVKENVVNATCTKKGSYEEVISCTVCEEEISRTLKSTDEIDHVLYTDMASDKEGHWHKCYNCDTQIDYAAHVPGPAATEENAQTCTICGYVLALPVGHTHAPVLVEGVAAKCLENGTKAYYSCESCGKWFADATAEEEIVDKTSIVIPATGHSYAEAWETDEENHWHKASCEHTDVISEKQAHTFKDGTCTVCGLEVPVEYVFEAECVDLSDFNGAGYSGGAQMIGAIITDWDGSAKASGGYFVSFLYVKGDDTKLTFKITSDRDVDDASLSIRLSGEVLETVAFTWEEWKVKVNGEAIDYGDIEITGCNTDLQTEWVREFEDYLLTTKLNLKKGENIIELLTDNETPMAGTMYATAPMVDCLKITTTAKLSWNPIQNKEPLES